MHQSRTIHINRINLLPVEQDIYDDKGRVVTVATYSNYKEFNGQQFPMLIIDIKRPLDEYSLKIQVTKLTLNEPFDAMTSLNWKVPDGVIPVQTMR